jgi:outer membrane autotransporter protein
MIGFRSSSATSAAGSALVSAGAPLFVTLSAPRLVSSQQSSSVASSTIDISRNAPVITGLTFNNATIISKPDGSGIVSDPSITINIYTFLGPQTVPYGYLGVCKTPAPKDGRHGGFAVANAGGSPEGSATPTGCVGASTSNNPAPTGSIIDVLGPHSFGVRAGNVDYHLSVRYDETIDSVTTVTTTDLITQSYQIDGVAKPVAFRSVALTHNQMASADAIQALGAGPLYTAVLTSANADDARQAFDTASGEVHASAVTIAYEDARLVRESVLDRLRSGSQDFSLSGVASGGATFTAPAGFGAAYTAQSDPTARAQVATLEPKLSGMWGQGFGSWGSTRSDGNAGSLKRSTGGFIVGADAAIDARYRFGFAGGYTSTSLNVDSRASTGEVQTIFGSVYGGARFGAVDLRYGGAYGGNHYNLSRGIAFPGFSDFQSASYGGATAQVFGEAGFRIPLGAGFIEPFVGAAMLRARTNGFQETGSAATALTGQVRDHDLATTTLALRGEINPGSFFGAGTLLSARGHLGWQHALGDVTPVQALAYSGASAAFEIAGVPVDRNALIVQAGFDLRVSQATTFTLSYAGQQGARASDNAVRGRLDYRF